MTLTLTLTLALTLTKVTPSLVRVYFDISYQIDGVAGLKYVGAGVWWSTPSSASCWSTATRCPQRPGSGLANAARCP